METTEKVTVEMTAEESEKYEAFKQAEAKREAAARRKADRDAYTALVDETIDAVMPRLMGMSDEIARRKTEAVEAFCGALEMKAELFGVKDDQKSHTFTNSEGTKRIVVGHYVLDDYRDTVDEGIAMVKGYIESLAKDDASRSLVKAILKLLSRDSMGNLKAQRVLQLRQLAEETGDERFIEGVRIIEESYQPSPSKNYIRAAVRGESGAWVPVPLSMTEV